MASSAEEMFRRGAEAAARAGNCTPRYVCPLCRASFFKYDSEELTKEHIPTEALGGKVLCLTCRRCNNEAGNLLQAGQVEREHQQAFWRGDGKEPLNLEVETPAGVIRGEVEPAGEPRQFTIHHHRTNPAVLGSVPDAELTISGYRLGRKFDWGAARVADLRDAYLWVFAQYGYSLVAVEYYEWIRDAVKTGRTTKDKWAIRLDDPFTGRAQELADGPVILVTSEPESALVVANGARGCVLPTPHCPDPYVALGVDKATIAFRNKALRVPTSLVMTWDLSKKA